ncbi:MAG: hypothetical protein WGN25_19605 [Candidatus Electrothrix sp. GW3-4]|uniref:hypothetical protein n=1 Tax=Candidatus Electrothrix sp. GW3-4 TaxID=3126740 RepID=UPI0030CD0F91
MARLSKALSLPKIFFIAMMLTAFWGTFIPRAEALSMGPYLDISTGSGTLEWDRSGEEFDIDMNTAAVGFVLDTAPANPTVPSFFNYRLNIGLEGKELEDEFNNDLDLVGITMENIFAFSLVQAPSFRWWLGPLLHLSAHSGEGDTVFDEYGYPYDVEYDFVQYGLGIVTGINFKVNPYMTFSSSIGFRVLETKGTASLNYYYTYDRYITYSEEDLEGSTESFFLNFALLF